MRCSRSCREIPGWATGPQVVGSYSKLRASSIFASMIRIESICNAVRPLRSMDNHWTRIGPMHNPYTVYTPNTSFSHSATQSTFKEDYSWIIDLPLPSEGFFKKSSTGFHTSTVGQENDSIHQPQEPKLPRETVTSTDPRLVKHRRPGKRGRVRSRRDMIDGPRPETRLPT
jgi:hypothetical protein